MRRIASWQTDLSDYLCRASLKKFSYSGSPDTHDCGTFTAGAIQALTGIDVAAPLRDTYTSRRGAFDRIKSLCGAPTMEALGEFLAAQHGFPEVPVVMAQRGDPVLVSGGSKSSLGIVCMYGTEILVPGKDGLLRLSLDQATRAWRI